MPDGRDALACPQVELEVVMRRVVVLSVVLAVSGAVHHSYATTPQRASCEVESVGKIEPGLTSLAVPTKEGVTWLAGTMRCTGWAFGQELTDRPARVTLRARNDSGLTGAAGASCLYADLDFAVRAVFPPGHGHGGVTVTGTMNYLGEAFDAELTGGLGGERLLGRSGIGSDPDGVHGLCTTDAPYRDLALVAQLVLVDDRGEGVDHQQVIASDEYVNGGTANAIAVTTPAVISEPVAAGDTITWTNADTHPHTVTACKAPCEEVAPVRTHVFDGDMLQPFTTFTLDTASLRPGTYDYFCEYHPFMRGSFTVGQGPLRPTQR